MATASVNISPECSICCEHFKSPKVLKCGHTYCLECLQRYIGDKTETFPCPICQQDITIPDGGAKMLATNFVVELFQNTTHSTGTTSPTTHVTGTTSPTTQVTGTTSPTTQVTGTTSPTSQVTGTTSPTTQVTGTTSHTTHLTDKTFSMVKYHCPCHRERPIDYYCLTCHCVLCHKCFLKEHNGHEYLDVECETAKEKATKLVLTSEKFIQTKIKDLEETHAALIEARETLHRFTEDACSRITKQTDKIILDIKAGSERIMTDIKNKSEESESELTKAGEKIKGDIKNFKLNLEANFPSLTKDCSLQILVSLEKIKELELCKDVKVITPSVVQYLDWNEEDFSFNIDMLGSVVLKQYHIPKLHESNSCRFLFNINDIKKDGVRYYNQDKFSNSNLVWSCCVFRLNGNVGIGIELLLDDNPKLNYCIIDSQVSLLNIDDNSKTITRTVSDERLVRGGWCDWLSRDCLITWSKLTDKNNGYLNSNSQFIVQFDITQTRGISFQ